MIDDDRDDGAKDDSPAAGAMDVALPDAHLVAQEPDLAVATRSRPELRARLAPLLTQIVYCCVPAEQLLPYAISDAPVAR